MTITPRGTEQIRAVPLPAIISDTLVQREIDTPLGPMQLAATARGMASARFLGAPETLASSAVGNTGDEELASAHLDEAAEQLRDYFAGEEVAFDVPLDLSVAGGFGHDVLLAARRIPYGRIATYSEVATWAGNPQAARAAGNALHNNPLCVIVPCHRVVPREGGLGGFAAGADTKAQLLRLEGVSLL